MGLCGTVLKVRSLPPSLPVNKKCLCGSLLPSRHPQGWTGLSRPARREQSAASCSGPRRQSSILDMERSGKPLRRCRESKSDGFGVSSVFAPVQRSGRGLLRPVRWTGALMFSQASVSELSTRNEMESEAVSKARSLTRHRGLCRWVFSLLVVLSGGLGFVKR